MLAALCWVKVGSTSGLRQVKAVLQAPESDRQIV